jgi:S-adenosylmethionine:tRNA ribosyltransferase-isomerase
LVRLSDFDYELPEELIAQTPLADRASSRLLHLERTSGAIHHRQFRQVVDLLEPGDVLVMNNTRVNAWRFIGRKETGAEIEILALNEKEECVFECLVKPAKRMKPGAKVDLSDALSAEMVSADADGPTRLVRFTCSEGDLYTEMSKAGTVPLPPYITKLLDDPERYQTVVASQPGSAAAPTAGLHFTPDILAQLKEKGVHIVHVTLHVGIDTFRPIQVDDVTEHKMHGEVCEILPQVAKVINEASGRVIAVGTTAVRTVETFATGPKQVGHGRLTSTLFIRPGSEFKAIDGMFTNFHLPKTTMLLMISTLSSRESILNAYKEAVKERYRFLSFGDSMLIL